MSTDAFAEYDAAYVLGALSPEDRRDYEAHLATCDDCARAVGELAGMPGLLARVPREEVELPKRKIRGGREDMSKFRNLVPEIH